ncbi:MAG: TetR family transcriptional regulator [Streptosporangiales bacterium]|nr:TetR family transcriptional regulator [Streptosporangiales bacterium]
MGNREDLLAGAKRCLYEKGYARTTARDIAAASGTSLAAIGYHFGSKEALLNAALVQAVQEWGDELGDALAAEGGAGGSAAERFESIWTTVVELFARHRQLWAANFEIFPHLERAPEMRRFFAEAAQLGRQGLVSLFQNVDMAAVDERTAQTLGSFYHALVLGVMAQHLIDPERAPSGRDLAEALRIITANRAPGR